MVRCHPRGHRGRSLKKENGLGVKLQLIVHKTIVFIKKVLLTAMSKSGTVSPTNRIKDVLGEKF